MREPQTRTKYVYDALNREKSTTYSNGETSILTNYDESNCLGLSPCQNVGQRTSMTDAAGSESWAYLVDASHTRSVHVNQRTTNSETRTATYYLDLAGNTTQMVYPSGRTVNYTFDNANRPKTATDGSNGITYATGFQTPPTSTNCTASAVCYTPQGSPYALSIGQSATFTGLNLLETANSRLQPNEIKATSTGGNAFDLVYSYADPLHSNYNAGHVYGITNNLDSTRSQQFTYDQLNRIATAQTTSTYATSPTHCWSEVFAIDPWANLTSISATTNSAYTGCSQESGFSVTANGNNHVGLLNFNYDPSGNTTQDAIYNYSWNAESQMTYSSGGSAYYYDGAGRRVNKSGGNEPKLYWYGSGGEILTETSPTSLEIVDYVYFGGKRVAQVPNDLNLNGGFESGLQNWTATGPGTATAVNNPANAHSGSYYADIYSPASTNTSLTTSQPISAQKGETITATGWVYRETGSNFYSVLWLTLYGDGGQCQLASEGAQLTTMNTWFSEGASITIPSWCEGPYTVSVYVQVGNSSNGTQSASARFDDITLNGNTLLFAEDSLGSTRVVTDTSGVVCYDGDFYPYGGERPYTNTCTTHYKFEGKERDVETGNDDFGARYYSNRFGRWLSADWSAVPVAVPYANLTNPQTLNLYSMVADDPESFADLDGHGEDGLFQAILDSVYVKGSGGIGLGVNVKVLGVKGEVEASSKIDMKVSLAGNVDANQVNQAQVGVTAKVPGVGEVTAGPQVSQSTPIMKDNQNVPNGEQQKEVKESVGIKVRSNESSISKNDVAVAGASVCAVICAGVEVGIDTKHFKDPGPPPGPKPPSPPTPPPQVWCGQSGSPCK